MQFTFPYDSTAQRAVQSARAYYHGDHPIPLTERQRAFLGGRVKLALNYCRLVVDAVVERLTVRGFAHENAESERWLWQLWNLARLDALSKALHLAVVRDGDAYLLVDYDGAAGRPRFSLNPADDGKTGLTLFYDGEGQPAYAVKRWAWGGLRRLNLYFPDRIEKYVAEGAGWQAFPDSTGAHSFPWVDADGQPLGLPIVHFRNREEAGAYGRSELSDLFGLQDALNKTLLDLCAVADTNAFPLLVALGFELPKEFSIAPGALIQVPPSLDGQNDFKMIAGAEVGNFLRLLEGLVLEMARVSSTPLSRIQASAQVAAEGTLKQQEAGLIAKVEHKQVSLGNAWEDAMRLASRLEAVFGRRQRGTDGALSTLWRPVATRSEEEHLRLLLLKAQLGVPAEVLLKEAGYGG
jgi:hypothetical protein